MSQTAVLARTVGECREGQCPVACSGVIDSNQGAGDAALIRDFLGMGYLSQRSYRKTLMFLIAGTAMEAFKLALDKAGELADRANGYLQWIGKALTLPDWLNVLLNLLAALTLVLGIVLFFSKKKVVEISFTNKRFCIPQGALSDAEYMRLYQTIKSLK